MKNFSIILHSQHSINVLYKNVCSRCCGCLVAAARLGDNASESYEDRAFKARCDLPALDSRVVVDVNAVPRIQEQCRLPGALEIPMESFARSVEIVLKDGMLRDTHGYRPDAAVWKAAVLACGYIQSRRAISHEMLAAAA